MRSWHRYAVSDLEEITAEMMRARALEARRLYARIHNSIHAGVYSPEREKPKYELMDRLELNSNV